MQRFLFDRLCDPLAATPCDAHGKLMWLRKSITEALQHLFTHRSFFEGVSSKQSIQGVGFDCVLNWGLQDLMSQSATIDDVSAIKEDIRRLILRYEPRLLCPDIEVVPSSDPLQPALLQITGTIKAGELEDDFLWRPVIRVLDDAVGT